MRRGLAIAFLLSAACGREAGEAPEPRPPAADREQLYQADTTVLEDANHGPELCLGGILTSLPPQCGDVPLANWDWEVVGGEETMGQTTWGEYHVVGTYDGDTFTVVRTGPDERLTEMEDDIMIGCPEPEGGWTVPDPARTSETDLNAATAYARHEPDHSGSWVQTTEGEGVRTVGENTVLNVGFTGDLGRHEADIREMWGGPLCVVHRQTTLDELLRIQAELTSGDAGGLDLHVLWSAPNETDAVLEVGVVLADQETREAVDARYGAGVVELDSALRAAS